MPSSRSKFVFSLFSTLALLAAACGDDTGGSGGSVGSGGNGSGGDPSTTSAGGAGGDPSTTSTTTGGSTSLCETFADVAIEKANELGCASIDRDVHISECESVYDQFLCDEQFDAMLECVNALPSSGWLCDPASNQLKTTEEACSEEAAAFFACVTD